MINIFATSGLASLKLSNAPVNSFSKNFLMSVTADFKSLEANSDVKGILLSSAFEGRVFSAGFDILEMFNK